MGLSLEVAYAHVLFDEAVEHELQTLHWLEHGRIESHDYVELVLRRELRAAYHAARIRTHSAYRHHRKCIHTDLDGFSFFVSASCGGSIAFIAGPFRSNQAALETLAEYKQRVLSDYGTPCDSWGTVQAPSQTPAIYPREGLSR